MVTQDKINAAVVFSGSIPFCFRTLSLIVQHLSSISYRNVKKGISLEKDPAFQALKTMAKAQNELPQYVLCKEKGHVGIVKNGNVLRFEKYLFQMSKSSRDKLIEFLERLDVVIQEYEEFEKGEIQKFLDEEERIRLSMSNK